MKTMFLAMAMLSANAAMADGYDGHHRDWRDQRGRQHGWSHGRGGWKRARPVWYEVPRYQEYARPPVAYVQLPFGAISVQVGHHPMVHFPIGARVNQLPPGSMIQQINGYTYASVQGNWFYWNGADWQVVDCPY